MSSFTYYAPTKVVFGSGTADQAGALVKEQNPNKVLIHYGGQSAVKSGLIDRIKKSLNDENIPYEELGGVVPNPHLGKVYEGIDLCRKEGIDFILAVGGGSVIDSAKTIAYGLANDNDVWDFYDKKASPKASAPIGVVLTIAAAGSEMSDSSVITNEKTKEKRGMHSNYCQPKFAIMDPELTLNVPDYQTSSANTDILMHTMERWFTNGDKMELTDALAKGLMKTVLENARILKRDPKNLEAREQVMWASSLSHNGLTGCGNTANDFATHNLEHELSGMFDVAHGAGLAALWPWWARYVMNNCLPRFVKFATDVMGVEPQESDEATALAGIEAFEDFLHEIGMPTSLKELLGREITEDEVLELARRCAIAKGGKCGSAKVLYEPDMAAIYRAANH